jgi:CO/xanthine dehydrogenase FAD-binding subunit
MALWQQYHLPTTISEALALLEQYHGQARVIGGGTDLLLEMQQGHQAGVQALIDVTTVEEMRQLRVTNGWVEVGAALTLSEIVESELLAGQATCLVESCGVIGGPQVRNVGTLGGNVAHALPAADGTTALVALNARAEIAGPQGRRLQPILELFEGAGRSAVNQHEELIVRFHLPVSEPGQGSAFKRIMRPQGVALPILACAVWLELADLASVDSAPELDPSQAIIQSARICVGPLSPVPVRLSDAEERLAGVPLTDGLGPGVAAARSQFAPRTSKHRATSEYRHEMIDVLLRRALPLAARRALTGQAIPEGIGL